MKRLTQARLLALAGELSERERAITEAVVRLRLLSGKQAERLYFAAVESPPSRARLTRRTLARLVELGVLARLERRVGGVRAGAAGHIYYATSGRRLLSYWQGDGLGRAGSAYEPTGMFTHHTLGISESYVRLVESDRAKTLSLREFQAEPAAWRQFTGPGGRPVTLKPDAFVRLGLTHEDTAELHAFLEIDCGSEGRAALTRKCRAYVTAWRSGIATDVFPRVAWIVTTERRAELLGEVCASMPAEAWKLFVVTTPEHTLKALGITAATGEAA
jgi:hypothetical protein